jgi:addiction module HigA family antidote
MSKSPTTAKKLPLIYPGEVLADALREAGVAPNRAAIDMGIPANRLHGIIHGTRAITADTAMRLGRYFGTSAEVWMNLQMNYELSKAKKELAQRVAAEVRPLRMTA